MSMRINVQVSDEAHAFLLALRSARADAGQIVSLSHVLNELLLDVIRELGDNALDAAAHLEKSGGVDIRISSLRVIMEAKRVSITPDPIPQVRR